MRKSLTKFHSLAFKMAIHGVAVFADSSVPKYCVYLGIDLDTRLSFLKSKLGDKYKLLLAISQVIVCV